MHPRPLGCHPKYRMPSRRDNVQGIKSSGAQGNPRSTPPFLGGLGGSQSPEPSFSLVPSTARSLFDGSKRECGVGTVGSGRCHALADRSKYKACGAVLSTTPQPCFCHLIRHGCAVPPSPQGEGLLLFTRPLPKRQPPHPIKKSTLSGAFFCAIFTFSRFPVPLPPCGTAQSR